ncbi:MAG: hypothetical protein IJX62_03810 [Clostridia bacterium]|nr:hypothetical protein [Clostridia bacterium]
MKIPKKYKALRSYVLKKDLKRILLWLLWMALCLAGALSYNYNHQTYPPERRMVGWRMAVWILATALLGFFLFRCWEFISLRALRGTISESGLSHSYTPSATPFFKLDFDFRTNTALRIRLANGKKKGLRFEEKDGFYYYYYEGNEILRFHGLPYPINLDPAAPHGYLCVVCGRIHNQMQPLCDACELPLIDPKELTPDPADKH